LVADDNEDSADSLCWLLQLYGHEVFTVYSGAPAIDAAERVRPHLIFLDIGMPDLDGYEVAQRIRQSDWGRQVTLVAVTGYGTQRDRQLAQAAGFDHHFLKPLEMTLLDGLLEVLSVPKRPTSK
jgi:CheY-like chemotaxis protein